MLWSHDKKEDGSIWHWSYAICNKGCLHMPTIFEQADGSCFYADRMDRFQYRDAMPPVGPERNIETVDHGLHMNGFEGLQLRIARRGIS